MKTYNWQQPDWPHFRYDLSSLYEKLLFISEKMGLIDGKLSHLAKDLQTETWIKFMVEEAVKTSEIEGEHLSRSDVRSSIKNTLGINQKKIQVRDKRAQGIAELMLDVRNTFKEPLTETHLFDWHLMLMSASTNPHLRVGYWRTDNNPMQIVSGYLGKQIVHYEAPPSTDIPREMDQFIHWFNKTAPGQLNAIEFAPVRAAIAHLYFESIHPFEDGNGRIGRAIAEKALSQGFGYPIIISLSQIIDSEKKAYYTALKSASKTNEITDWIRYFIDVIIQAQFAAQNEINFILKKTTFFDKYQSVLNERQLKVIKRMMQFGVKGFKGGMSAKKYMSITGSSKATATRDLQQLVAIKVLIQTGSGRSVRYELNL